jgi:hypothetical protein
MNTIFAVAVAVALFYWCGTGPTLLLFRRPSPYRIAAIPVVGICSGVVFTLLLARFGLTGKDIAVTALLFFCVCNLLGCWLERPSTAEIISYLPVALCCLSAVTIAAWPLARMGYSNYWGFANPDHALYISLIDYLQTHSFGVAPGWFRGSFYTLSGENISVVSYDSSVILGISYFVSMLSLVTRAPVSLLFGVTTAAVACIVPASSFLLCSLGLQLPRRVSLTAAALTACSSLVAYTFYLHSLGAMTVIAILPVGIAFVLDYFRNPRWEKLPVTTLVFGGAYFDYFPGFAILGLATAAIAFWTLFTRKSRIGPVFLLGGFIVACVLALSPVHAVTIFRRLLYESSFSGSQFSKTNELLVTFALVLTERGLPFFWGLWLPYGGDVAFFKNGVAQLYAGLAVSAALFLSFGLAAWRSLAGISREYICGVAALLGLIVLYTVTGNGGYGAFKIVAWIHPLVIVALAASTVGSWHWLRVHRHRSLSLLPMLVLAGYATLNIVNAIHLGRESIGGVNATLNNAPRLQLKDFRELQGVADKWGNAGIIVALPDSVAQNWLIPFFRHSITQFFPQIHLNVEDSSPRLSRNPPMGEYVLHWIDDSQELEGLPVTATVWRNDKFGLTPLTSLHEALVFGRGWYRKEGMGNSSFEWQHHLRWLRKRGELLILNPSPTPKRALMNLIAGYSSSSPARHIDIYLNGEKFDEIVFFAQTRVLTRPFTAPGPWSQLEFVVHEDAVPQPREHALWNRWVPVDSRSLNVAVSAVSLIDSDQADALVNASIDFQPGHPNDGLMNGVFPDGWIGESADVFLRVPPNVRTLEIAGTVPGVSSFAFPYQATLSLDGEHIQGVRIAGPGDFRLQIPLGDTSLVPGRPVHLMVGPLSTFTGRTLGINNDPRELSLKLNRIALVGGNESGATMSGKKNSRSEHRTWRAFDHQP